MRSVVAKEILPSGEVRAPRRQELVSPTSFQGLPSPPNPPSPERGALVRRSKFLRREKAPELASFTGNLPDKQTLRITGSAQATSCRSLTGENLGKQPTSPTPLLFPGPFCRSASNGKRRLSWVVYDLRRKGGECQNLGGG